MKKILFALFLGCSSLAALSNGLHAQKTAEPVAFNNPKIFKNSIHDVAVLESPFFMGNYVADVSTINTKALKDFSARFDNTNATWFEDKNGYVSYFVKNGYGDRAYYDKKGHWQYSLIFYGEDKLPKDLRSIVKSANYDLSITLVEEVQTTEGKGYVIHLEDKSNIKIIKMNAAGEMETMQELTKQ